MEEVTYLEQDLKVVEVSFHLFLSLQRRKIKLL